MVDRDFLQVNRWRPEQEKINKNKAVEKKKIQNGKVLF